MTVHDNKVIVSDWGNHRVQVFTLNGDFIKQIGKQGIEKTRIFFNQNFKVLMAPFLSFI